MPQPLIAIFLQSLLPLGGVEAVRLQLARQFLKLGYRVDLVLADETHDWREVVPEGVRTIVFGKPRIRNAIRPLVRYLRHEKPDALMVAMWPLTVAGIAAHKLSGSRARLLVSEHQMLSIQYRDWGLSTNVALRASIASTFRFANARICVSSGVADDIARFSGLPRRLFTVIHNPLPISMTDRRYEAEAEAAWRVGKGARILTVGRFKEAKNHKLLVRAFKRVLSIRADAHLMILGVGELFETTREYIRSLGLDEFVATPGQSANPSAYYRSADLFVLSSDYEGFGNVLVEALAHGLPVVSTNCPSGPSDILDNGRHGRLVQVGDEIGLADAMLAALSSSHDSDVTRQRAADFSPERVAKQYLTALFG